MQEVPKVGDIIESKHTLRKGEVIEVNSYWGWYKVKYSPNFIREYRITHTSNSSTRICKPDDYIEHFLSEMKEARADSLLKAENMGITDYWRE